MIRLDLLLLVVTIPGTLSLLCYSCTDLHDNNDCFNVVKCRSLEKCFGRSDGQTDGSVTHTTGCTTELVVPRLNGTTGGFTFCAVTCTGDFCNLNVCVPAATVSSTKPPRCLQCNLVTQTQDCTTVKQCALDEVCYTQRFRAFGNERYRLGCIHKQHCGAIPRTPTLVGKRVTGQTDCDVCCHGDNCNLDACSENGTVATYDLHSISPNAPCNDADPSLCMTLGHLNTELCGEVSIVKHCSKSCDTCDHVGWTQWSVWGHCSKSCAGGTHSRTRQCQHRIELSKNQTCIGVHSSETASCNTQHCPIDGGWCYTSGSCNCGPCRGEYPKVCCSTCTTRSTCNCPSPKYGGTCH